MNLYLIGFRCSGKSTIGRAVAESLNRKFVDTDELVCADNGMSIAELVSSRGWGSFRDSETEIIRRLSHSNNLVVATGGGSVLEKLNVLAMRSSGVIVWLQRSIDGIRTSILRDECSVTQRPPLTALSIDLELETIMREREPLYRAAMDFSVDTDDFDIPRLCETIATEFRHRLLQS